MKIKIRHAQSMPKGTYLLAFHRYTNGDRIALQIYDAETGEPWMRPTLWTAGLEPLPPEYVCVKDYSENTGITQDLIRNGVIEPASLQYVDGFPAYKLTEAALEEARRGTH